MVGSLWTRGFRRLIEPSWASGGQVAVHQIAPRADLYGAAQKQA